MTCVWSWEPTWWQESKNYNLSSGFHMLMCTHTHTCAGTMCTHTHAYAHTHIHAQTHTLVWRHQEHTEVDVSLFGFPQVEATFKQMLPLRPNFTYHKILFLKIPFCNVYCAIYKGEKKIAIHFPDISITLETLKWFRYKTSWPLNFWKLQFCEDIR